MYCIFPWLGTYSFLAMERFLKIRCADRLGLKGFISLRPYYMQFTMAVSEQEFYGRPLIDRKKGITVTFADFGDSSVDLSVKQMVLVQEKYRFISEAKEIIYNTLNANGINIPFPQRDIHVIEDMPKTINTESK